MHLNEGMYSVIIVMSPEQKLISMCMGISEVSKSKVSDLSQEWPKGSLSNSYYRGVGEGAIPFLGLLHFTLDPYLIMLSARQGGIFFSVFGMTQPELNPALLDH